MYPPEILEILVWVAKGYDLDVEDQYHDAIGKQCIFDACQYDTSSRGRVFQHSQNCLQTKARALLAAEGIPLRQYDVEFQFTYHGAHKYGLSQQSEPQHRIFETIEPLNLDIPTFIKEQIEFEERYSSGAGPIMIDPSSVIIHPPHFLLA